MSTKLEHKLGPYLGFFGLSNFVFLCCFIAGWFCYITMQTLASFLSYSVWQQNSSSWDSPQLGVSRLSLKKAATEGFFSTYSGLLHSEIFDPFGF